MTCICDTQTAPPHLPHHHASAESLALAALHALARGQALLHPTDTLPGLAFDPRRADGGAVLARVKGRPLNKPCLGLVADLTAAQRFFAPLPPGWQRVLSQLWPASLSVVWTASPAAPRSLLNADGTIGLRVAPLPAGAGWMNLLLRALDLPLPTTSVNTAGQPPATTWAAAVAFAQQHPDVALIAPPAELTGAQLAQGCAPIESQVKPTGAKLTGANLADDQPERSTNPALASTIIRLHDDGSFAVLRAGAVSVAAIHEALA